MAQHAAPVLHLFVYGTLKRGGVFHERMCRGAVAIEEASTRGRLYQNPAGYPVLAVGERAVLAEGTTTPLADLRTQNRLDARAAERSAFAEGDVVRGELIRFDDALTRLPILDDFEDFHPGRPGLYRRVLLPVKLERSAVVIAAWIYAAPAAENEDA